VQLELEGECRVGFPTDVCFRRDVNTSFNGASTFHGFPHSRYFETKARTNVNSK
jgi:hypothetical protein